MKFIKILLLSAIFSSRIFACALCALYTPTAHVSITPVAQDGRIVSLHFSWLFSKKAAQTVAKESGASVVEIDQLPLDWDAELRKTAQIFAKSL